MPAIMTQVSCEYPAVLMQNYGLYITAFAFWTLHMAGCKNVLIDGIRILNQDRGPNNDGIDPDCCQNVVIQNCIVESGDHFIYLIRYGSSHFFSKLRIRYLCSFVFRKYFSPFFLCSLIINLDFFSIFWV